MIIVIVSLLAVGFLGVTDFLTGSELSFSIFYLGPVMFAAWMAGRLRGYLVAWIGALTWMTADLAAGAHYAHSLIPIWNTVVRLGFFILVTFLLSELYRVLRMEKALARVDSLTGTLTPRAFFDAVDQELKRARRSPYPLTIAFLDMDNFKMVNDKLGHPAGDRLLQAATEVMRSAIRDTDILGRVGGDEFTFFFPDTDAQGAKSVVEKIRQDLLEVMQREDHPVTVSIGVITCLGIPPSLEHLFKLADTLMYEVKQQGKNGVKFSVLDSIASPLRSQQAS